MEIQKQYPNEYKKVMSGNLRYSFGSLSNDLQEETLKQMRWNNGNN